MIKSILHTNLNKLIALGIGTVLFSIVIYKISISKTVSLYVVKNHQTQLISNSQNLEQELAMLSANLQSVQASLLQPYDKKNILEKVTDFCRANDLLVVTFPTTQSNKLSNYDILTNEIVVKGNYSKIVELVYLIEREEKLSSVNNIKFELIKNKKTKREELTAKITLRNIAA